MQDIDTRRTEIGSLFEGAPAKAGAQYVSKPEAGVPPRSGQRRRRRAGRRDQGPEGSAGVRGAVMTIDMPNPASRPSTLGQDKPGNAHALRAVRRRLQEIRPHPLAHGLLDPRHVAKLKRDIQEHGQRNPITVARDSNSALVIEDGHHRFAAMEALGLTEIWVVIRPYPSSDPAVVRELTSQLSRRKSAAERTSLLLRAVIDLMNTGRLEGVLANSEAGLSRRAALGRAFDVNENLAGKLLTIAEAGLTELADRLASAPLTTVRLECLYQLAQIPRDAQLAALEALGEVVLYMPPDDVQVLRHGLSSADDIPALVRQWGQQIIARLESEHAGAASKTAAKVITDIQHSSARLPGPARRLFRQQLIDRLTAEDRTAAGISSVDPARRSRVDTGATLVAPVTSVQPSTP